MLESNFIDITFRHGWSPVYLLYKIYVSLLNVFTFNLRPVSAGKGIPKKSLAELSDFVIYLFYVLFLFISANFVSQLCNFLNHSSDLAYISFFIFRFALQSFWILNFVIAIPNATKKFLSGAFRFVSFPPACSLHSYATCLVFLGESVWITLLNAFLHTCVLLIYFLSSLLKQWILGFNTFRKMFTCIFWQLHLFTRIYNQDSLLDSRHGLMREQ